MKRKRMTSYREMYNTYRLDVSGTGERLPTPDEYERARKPVEKKTDKNESILQEILGLLRKLVK